MQKQYNHSPQRRTSFRPRQGGNYNRGRGGFKKAPNRISHDKFINVNKTEAQDQQVEHLSDSKFSDFDFQPILSESITSRGYERPTPIQEKTIQHILGGSDVIGLANTGTGKTAAFILPIINNLLIQKSNNAAIIIAPTRELAHQIKDEFRLFTRGMKLFSVVCVGGESMQKQKSEIRRGVNVIVGTPGRLKDLIGQGILDLSRTKMLVLDEADQMLDMGFLPDIQFIMQNLPETRQVVCFSATMTSSIERLLSNIQKNAVIVSTVANITGEHIDQNILRASSKEDKMKQITTMLQRDDFKKVLIFGETKFGVQRLAEELTNMGHQAHAIHGNKSQSQRQRALKSFKNQPESVLVATDVAARGLDIPNVHLVINYDIPQTYDTYIHRIGRTGRAGNKGVARTFV